MKGVGARALNPNLKVGENERLSFLIDDAAAIYRNSTLPVTWANVSSASRYDKPPLK
jgi:hypothetical protein